MKLEPGNVIELANGERYIYSNMFPDLIDFTGSKFINLYDYDETSMKYKSGDDDRDVRRIYSDYTLTTVIWERDIGVKLTETERAILSGLSHEYKWIARDEDGGLYIFKTKPRKGGVVNLWRGEFTSFEIYNHLFKFISWNDSIPRLITALLYN